MGGNFVRTGGDYPASGTTTHRTDPPPPVLNSEMAVFGPGGHVHVRSRTEKRPSSRPLLLPNRPLFAAYMPYLLSYCAGATSCPGPAATAPPGPRLCGLCELRYGPWGVALLLLHLLLLLTGGKENLAVCHQHKRPCCCCRRLFLPPAAFAAAVVAALLPCLLGGPAALVAAPHVPTTPMFLFERNIVLRNTNGCSACSLFKQKALH